MRWEDERYVRLYTRDTTDWLALGWEAQALFILLLRKVDRAGLLELSRHGTRGLASLVAMPIDVVERALPILLTDGCVEKRNSMLVIRNFLAAQESRQSDKARKAKQREVARDEIRSGLREDHRQSVVYFIQSEHGGAIKIGWTDDLAGRLLSLQTSRPDALRVLTAVQGSSADERAMHERFAVHRIRGEWFAPHQDILNYIGIAESQNVTCHTESHGVTGGHTESQPVTPCLAVPSLADPPSGARGGVCTRDPRAPETVPTPELDDTLSMPPVPRVPIELGRLPDEAHEERIETERETRAAPKLSEVLGALDAESKSKIATMCGSDLVTELDAFVRDRFKRYGIGMDRYRALGAWADPSRGNGFKDLRCAPDIAFLLGGEPRGARLDNNLNTSWQWHKEQAQVPTAKDLAESNAKIERAKERAFEETRRQIAALQAKRGRA